MSRFSLSQIRTKVSKSRPISPASLPASPSTHSPHSPKATVLLTGANGTLGFRILTDLLKEGNFLVRVAVRSASKAETIQLNASIRTLNPTPQELSFITVPDVTAPNAYNEAVRGVKYIIHAAGVSPNVKRSTSSLSPAELREVLVERAVKGTVNLFQAAASEASQSVERVVVTGSMSALLPAELGLASGHSQDNLPQSVEEAHRMSKKETLSALSSLYTSSKLPFSAIHIHPSTIIGRDELASTPSELADGSNRHIFSQVVSSSSSPLASSAVSSISPSNSSRQSLADASSVEHAESFASSYASSIDPNPDPIPAKSPTSLDSPRTVTALLNFSAIAEIAPPESASLSRETSVAASIVEIQAIGGAVHISDLAKLHTLALSHAQLSGLKAGEARHVVANVALQWDSVPLLSARLFPAAYKRGILSNDFPTASVSTIPLAARDLALPTDHGQQEVKVSSLGLKLCSIKDCVASAGAQYIELVETSQGLRRRR